MSNNLSRRDVLLGGFGALVGASVGGGVAWAESAERREAEVRAEMQAAHNAALDEWRELVAAYEALEEVGLDETLARGLSTLATPLETVRDMVQRVQGGLQQAGDALKQLDEGLALLDTGLAAAEEAVNTLAEGVQRLEAALAAADERTGGLAQRTADFLRRVLGYLPFGMGERATLVFDEMTNLLAHVPESITAINTALLQPVRATFFPRTATGEVEVRLLDPFVDGVMAPVEQLLGKLTDLLNTLETSVIRPAQHALAVRAERRARVREWRERLGLEL